jgi:hypothetical protein
MISNQVNARQAEIMSDLSTKGYNDYEINKNLVVTINLGIEDCLLQLENFSTVHSRMSVAA